MYAIHQSGSPLLIMLLLAAAFPIGALAEAPETKSETPKLLYNRDIRPILAENCFACHGPDSASRKGDLRIDQRAVAISSNAFIPGNPAESEMIRRITSTDPDEVMPPPATKKILTDRQKEILRRWISEGAEYQAHWSLIAPTRPQLPQVTNTGWIRNPIDRFILRDLEKAGLTPAPETDRRTLARRLSLDLIGLPPDSADVDAFASDESSNYYENYVDRLLNSERWGEHRARYWLDYARYADTHGIHFDNFREIWSYRDWVIDAFNRNIPFTQFTIEQLAGDLLPQATLEQRIASGFNRCNITTSEGGAISEEYLVLYTRDRTETVSQVWMGLTANCSVCHDHKFDPLTMKDFYSMAAFFNNTTQAAMDGNIKDTPPILVVPRADDRRRWDQLAAEIPEAKKREEDRKQAARAEFDGWLSKATTDSLYRAIPTQNLSLHAPLDHSTGAGSALTTKVAIDGQVRDVAVASTATWQTGVGGTQALQPQGTACELADVGEFESDQSFTCAAWVKLPANDSSGAICARMDRDAAFRGWDFWVQGRRIGTHIVHSWPDNAVKVVGRNQVAGNEWTHIAVSYDGSRKASGVKVYYNGQPQPTNVEADKLKADGSIKTPTPFKVGQRSNGDPISGAALQDLRVYQRALSPAEIESLAKTSRFVAIVAKAADQRSEDEKKELYPWWLAKFDQDYQNLTAAIRSLEQEQNELKSKGTIAHVMQEKPEEAMAFVLFRGDYDKRRDPVKPGTPAALPPFPEKAPRNRLGFAQWLLHDDHPLTARVTVNRCWQEVFGTGIVKTAGDLGVAGELPSHPELLDWLALEFRDSGWNIKQFYKLLVMSNTYRQSARSTAEKREKDPDNRLLSRGPRYRMEGEMLRDYALASSNLLVGKIGGPSVRPYQPDGVWEAVAMIGSNTRDYRPEAGENLYRRSLYTFWKRSAPPASMEIFNAPSREFCVVRRERTNTPLQALVTLNDPQFVEAARHLAQTALSSHETTADGRFDLIAKRLLSRQLRPAEKRIVRQSLDQLTAHYQSHPEDAQALVALGHSKPDPKIDVQQLAAWTMLANELMNLDEVLNK